MHSFIQYSITEAAELGALAGTNGIVYFLVYDRPLEKGEEEEISARIDPQPFEQLIKFHKHQAGDLFSHIAEPVEYPALGLWYNGIKGMLWAEQMKREPTEVKEMAATVREWRRERLSFT